MGRKYFLEGHTSHGPCEEYYEASQWEKLIRKGTKKWGEEDGGTATYPLGCGLAQTLG